MKGIGEGKLQLKNKLIPEETEQQQKKKRTDSRGTEGLSLGWSSASTLEVTVDMD